MLRIQFWVWMTLTLGGLFACLASAFYVFQDWHALNVHYARFQTLVMSDAPLRSIFIAEAQQNSFRINCFADGIGVLLGAILMALGFNGLFATHTSKACPPSPR